MIGYMYDTDFLLHDTGAHIEIARRCEAIDEMVEEKYSVLPIETRVGDKKELCMVHDVGYVHWVEGAYDDGIRTIVSSDTVISAESYDVALKCATSTQNVITAFNNGVISRAFLNLRPPGHHAEYITGQGFCIFNNIALMARYAQEAGFSKVLIIDFDVHHGNGTQDIFYDDPSVYFFSTHEKNNYPYFTGAKEEIGKEDGVGFTQNMPYHDGIDDEEFLALFDVLPKHFDFDIVLVSAGYDLMNDEQISTSQISYSGLSQMVQKVLDFTGDKPIAFLLEGGYNIESLVQSVDITLDRLVNG
ncbi:MAG: histone deacetylase [Epsilonproteobacteria bacterium]|nr:histone deacetylase [Campylobacterota bacterium]